MCERVDDFKSLKPLSPSYFMEIFLSILASCGNPLVTSHRIVGGAVATHGAYPWQVYSKTCVKRLLSKRPKMNFKTKYRLMQVKSIAECSKGSILQYLRPSLTYHLSLRSLFVYFSGRFTQVSLYHTYSLCSDRFTTGVCNTCG